MTVEPEEFVAVMAAHWQGTLQNVPSDNLRAVWRQLCVTFNYQIAAFGTPEGERWKVLQPATGTGKSQGLALYCAMLPEVEHPGVLIVTRLKAQADELAETINKLANRQEAVAYHSSAECRASDLAKYPVAIITHRAYEIGLDAINIGKADTSSWSAYTAWSVTGRQLVVIDEALDIVEEAQVTVDQVRVLRAVLPVDITERFPTEVAAIEAVQDVLTQFATAPKGQGQERVLGDGLVPLRDDLDFTYLRQALREVRLDHLLLRRDDLGENKRLAQGYDQIIKGIHLTIDNWNWYAKKRKAHTMNTARLIVPEEVMGAVVLDATASSSLIYQLFEHRADVIPAPADARRYDNVTLHISTGHAVGKTSMIKAMPKAAGRLIGNLSKTISKDRKVFVCAHKQVTAHLVAFSHPFASFEVGHWGAIDGKNTWDNCDTVVIFGLPYRDNVWSANLYMALQGLQTTEWLQSEGDRPFRHFKDVRHALRVGQLVVNIVQAINRAQCRRVIDGAGNCKPTDVFILLPDDRTGAEVLSGIIQNMPGIKVMDWAYEDVRRKLRRSNHEEALVRYASAMQAGRRAVTRIRNDLTIPATTWERLAGKLRNTASSLSQSLLPLGVSYVVDGQGRCQRAFLVKTEL